MCWTTCSCWTWRPAHGRRCTRLRRRGRADGARRDAAPAQPAGGGRERIRQVRCLSARAHVNPYMQRLSCQKRMCTASTIAQCRNGAAAVSMQHCVSAARARLGMRRRQPTLRLLVPVISCTAWLTAGRSGRRCGSSWRQTAAARPCSRTARSCCWRRGPAQGPPRAACMETVHGGRPCVPYGRLAASGELAVPGLYDLAKTAGE